MKRVALFIAALLLLTVAETYTSENHSWTTLISIGKDKHIVMHWTHVYEGQDTVYLIEIYRGQEKLKEFNVGGQPILNENKSLVALPSCADDGCANNIDIIDLSSLKKLKSIMLNNNSGQFYIQCLWDGNVRSVSEETHTYKGDQPIEVVTVRKFEVFEGKEIK